MPISFVTYSPKSSFASTVLKTAVVRSQEPNLDPLGQAEKAVFPEKSFGVYRV